MNERFGLNHGDTERQLSGQSRSGKLRRSEPRKSRKTRKGEVADKIECNVRNRLPLFPANPLAASQFFSRKRIRNAGRQERRNSRFFLPSCFPYSQCCVKRPKNCFSCSFVRAFALFVVLSLAEYHLLPSFLSGPRWFNSSWVGSCFEENRSGRFQAKFGACIQNNLPKELGGVGGDVQFKPLGEPAEERVHAEDWP